MKKKKSFIGFFNLPKGMTRRLYLKNLIALALVLALALAALVMHTADHWLWIKNYTTDGYTLDFDAMEQTLGYRTAEPSPQTAKEQGYMTGSYGIPSMVYQDYVYFQNQDQYRFLITIDAVEETGLYYDDDHNSYFQVDDPTAWAAQVEALEPIMYEATQGVMAEYYLSPLERLVWLSSDGHRFLAMVPYDTVINPGDSLRGIFTRWGEYMVADYGHFLSLEGQGAEDILTYFFDIRDVPVEFEDEDWGYMVFYALITGLVLLLNLAFYIWPTFHPFFRQMQKYGEYDEITASIDEDFGPNSKFVDNRKTLLGDKWYIKKSAFMNVINRNPDLIPENQKAREGKVNKRRYSDYADKAPRPQDDKYDPLAENMKNRYNKYY